MPADLFLPHRRWSRCHAFRLSLSLFLSTFEGSKFNSTKLNENASLAREPDLWRWFRFAREAEAQGGKENGWVFLLNERQPSAQREDAIPLVLLLDGVDDVVMRCIMLTTKMSDSPPIDGFYI
jgi:hypothetical protein